MQGLCDSSIRGSMNPFTAEGERYDEYRPTYPPDLYSCLFSVTGVTRRDRALLQGVFA